MSTEPDPSVVTVWDVTVTPRTVSLWDHVPDDFDLDPNDRDWAESLESAQVGQWVIESNGQGGRHYRRDARQIVGVGRKNMYTDSHGRKMSFTIDGGRQTGKVYGPGFSIFTIWDLLGRRFISGVHERVIEGGMDHKYGSGIKISLAKMHAIAAILEAPE